MEQGEVNRVTFQAIRQPVPMFMKDMTSIFSATRLKRWYVSWHGNIKLLNLRIITLSSSVVCVLTPSDFQIV